MRITIDGEAVEIEIEVQKRPKSVALLIVHPDTRETLEIDIGLIEIMRLADAFRDIQNVDGRTQAGKRMNQINQPQD